MTTTFDMQEIRYINLFSRLTKVNTRFFFRYNEALVFCVPKKMLQRAIGEKGKNIRKMSEIIGKRVKVIAIPRGIEDAESFFRDIANPVQFKEIEVNDNEIIITAGKTNKAVLLGRGKRRLIEMQKIADDFFQKELRII